MLKWVTVIFVAAIQIFLGGGEARAQGRQGASGTTVQCNVGTCNPRGGSRATDVKFCRAQNCKKNGPNK
jgi:hypothetical protein